MMKKKLRRKTRKRKQNKSKKAKGGSWSLKKTMKKFKKDNCSPKGKDKLDFTCYTSSGLIKLKEIWNARHPDSMITNNDPSKNMGNFES